VISVGAIALGLLAVANFIAALIGMALPGWKTKPPAAVALWIASSIPIWAYYFRASTPWPMSAVYAALAGAALTLAAFAFLALRVRFAGAAKDDEAETDEA
jgi:TRAP-type C4-dicarboxylate transport system permease small subunit